MISLFLIRNAILLRSGCVWRVRTRPRDQWKVVRTEDTFFLRETWHLKDKSYWRIFPAINYCYICVCVCVCVSENLSALVDALWFFCRKTDALSYELIAIFRNWKRNSCILHAAIGFLRPTCCTVVAWMSGQYLLRLTRLVFKTYATYCFIGISC